MLKAQSEDLVPEEITADECIAGTQDRSSSNSSKKDLSQCNSDEISDSTDLHVTNSDGNSDRKDSDDPSDGHNDNGQNDGDSDNGSDDHSDGKERGFKYNKLHFHL